MIEVRDLTQHYSVRPVLRNINLTINRGELVVVVRPNGMGKTTLLGAMAGVLSPQRGSVTIDGKRRRGSEEEELAIRRMTVYLPDQPWLPAETTTREYLLAVARLYDVADERLFVQLDRLLRLFELADKGDSPIRSCSAGQKKKVALCGALLTEAPVLLLDEPFSGGLDPAGLLALKRVLQQRVAEEGGTIVLTSPVPEIVEEIAGRVLILRDGEVGAFETIDGLRRLTGSQGSLGSILEHLLYPGMASKLAEYFAGRHES
jgi:ABC-type multidrug transport system ATPase subunit